MLAKPIGTCDLSKKHSVCPARTKITCCRKEQNARGARSWRQSVATCFSVFVTWEEKDKRSPPMKVRYVAPALMVVALLALSSTAQAGLFSHGGAGCGCEPACGAPAPVWSDCCAPACDSCDSCCGHGHGLLHKLSKIRKPRLNLFGHHRGCCDSAPACGCEAEPACGCEAEPACAAEPACGCEAEPVCEAEPCCAPKRHCGGLLKRLFHHHRSACCDAEPACGCEAEPSCGCN